MGCELKTATLGASVQKVCKKLRVDGASDSAITINYSTFSLSAIKRQPIRWRKNPRQRFKGGKNRLFVRWPEGEGLGQTQS